jgi:hypothetical protein
MAIFNVLFFMAQVLPPWEREKLRHEIKYTSEQEKLRSERERLITLTTQVQHQSRTIDNQKTIIKNLTLKNEKCEYNITQLLETNSNLRTDNTALRRKCTESDAENFQLRHEYQYLKQEYDGLKNSYSATEQRLHILQHSLTR